jgi:hypothetical protein
VIFSDFQCPFCARPGRACEAAGKQGKFWEMYAKLFENTKALSDADVEGYAKELKLDVKQWKVDLASTAIKDRIEADKKQARELGANGTPAFFINGKFLSGAQPLESFKAAIDAEIVEADKLIARGVSKKGLSCGGGGGGPRRGSPPRRGRRRRGGGPPPSKRRGVARCPLMVEQHQLGQSGRWWPMDGPVAAARGPSTGRASRRAFTQVPAFVRPSIGARIATCGSRARIDMLCDATQLRAVGGRNRRHSIEPSE